MLPKALITALCAAFLAVSACGDGSRSGADAAPASGVRTAPTSALDNDLVKAVSPSKAGAAVDMKFKLASRPEAGRPVPLTLVFEPPADDVDRMTVSLSASEGLSIESGEGPATFVPSHGAPISHEMSVKADHDGIFFVTAAVLVDALDHSESSRSFSVPIIVGQGMPESVASARGVSESSGERLRPGSAALQSPAEAQ